MDHGVEVVAVMSAGTGGGLGVRSDVLYAVGWSDEIRRYCSSHAVAETGDINRWVFKCVGGIAEQNQSEANPDNPEYTSKSRGCPNIPNQRRG